jgi:hypothetical protein
MSGGTDSPSAGSVTFLQSVAASGNLLRGPIKLTGKVSLEESEIYHDQMYVTSMYYCMQHFWKPKTKTTLI